MTAIADRTLLETVLDEAEDQLDETSLEAFVSWLDGINVGAIQNLSPGQRRWLEREALRCHVPIDDGRMTTGPIPQGIKPKTISRGEAKAIEILNRSNLPKGPPRRKPTP